MPSPSLICGWSVRQAEDEGEGGQRMSVMVGYMVRVKTMLALVPAFTPSSATLTLTLTHRLQHTDGLSGTSDATHAILYYTILYCTMLYYTILYYSILYYTILYCTTLYYTVLHCTILYYTIV